MAELGRPLRIIHSVYNDEEVERIIDLICLGYTPKEIYMEVGRGNNAVVTEIKRFRDWYEHESEREQRQFYLENGIVFTRKIGKQMFYRGKEI